MDFDTSIFISALFSPAFAKGAVITLSLALLSHAAAVLLSLPMALVLIGKDRVGAAFVKAYIVIFRAIPLLLLLLLIWNGLPQIHPIFRESWFSPFLGALFGIAISEAAYQVEINRSALSALPEGQTDAGKALGLKGWQIFLLIKFPQAVRIALPPTVNEFITILKATSLATIISLRELMNTAQLSVAFSYRYAEYYSAALVYYVAMVMVLMVVQSALEKRMSWISK